MGGMLQSVLSGRNLTKSIELVKPGIPATCIPEGLLKEGEKVSGNQATAYTYTGTRKTAALVAYGGPSTRKTMSGVKERSAVLLHYFNNTGVKMSTLMNLLNDSEQKQRMGISEVQRIVKEVATIKENTRKVSVFSAIMTGYIYYDAAGNILPSSSGSTANVDFAIPASNRTQLNITGAGSVIDASWATAGTSIIKQMQNFKTQAMQANGYIPKYALYGSNIINYIQSNTQLKTLIDRTPGYQAPFANGVIPDGFLGIEKWMPGHQAFYEKADGSIATFLTGDNIVFLPEVEDSWFNLMVGSYPVPQNFTNVSADLESVVKGAVETFGSFAYATGEIDPPSATMYYGDTWLPWIRVPGAVYIATVHGF